MESASPNPEFEPGNGPTTYNLLFVCSGNTCRSPLARTIMQALLHERGWAHVRVDSAGTAAVDGAPAADHAIAVAAAEGLDLSAHRSQELTPELLDWADLVLVMTLTQLEAVARRGGAGKVALITDFIDGPGCGEAVVDPFGGDLDAYRETWAQLQKAGRSLIARLEPMLAP
jgi:protein-tyrosine-phosphatase